MNIRNLPLAMLLLLCSGCFWSSYHETTYFDLNCPPLEIKNREFSQIYVIEFENLTNAESRMQMRFPNGRIVADSYAKWILPPGELVPRALNELFLGAKLTGCERRIAGRLLKFEASKEEKCFLLAGSWKFREESRYHSFQIRTPLSSDTPEAISLAASAAVAQLATEIFAQNSIKE